MPAMIQPLLRSKSASFTLEFQDADDRNKPLPHARVQVDLLDTNSKPSGTLFQGRTNAEGKVSVRIPVPRAIAGQPPLPLPKIRIRVLDLDGDELKKQDVKPETDKPIPPIAVSDEPQKKKIVGAIDDGTPVLGRKLSLQLSALLKQHKVDSLVTLRNADPAAFAALPDQDKQDWAELNAHAQLQLVSRNHKVNQALVKAGYRSVLDIARQPRSEFMAKMKGKIDEDTSGIIYGTGRRQQEVLSNRHTEEQARSANGMDALSSGGPVVEPPCECNCDSAVSPQAYLVDLLDYAVDNVLVDGNPMTLPRLETTFGQPFAGLPVDCAFASLLVRQVRLCIEVLHRRHVLMNDDDVRTTAVTSALTAHAHRSYEALLRGLGTSYRELRLARSDAEAQKTLAERLGIAPDDVNSFRLELNSGDVNQQLNENNLERLFGLQGTARDPLSTGASFNDGQSQITRWQLRGVAWRENTDDLGTIYVSIVKRATGMHEIILYKRQARNQSSRLGMASTRGTFGEVELVAENNSGLAGRFEFKYTENDSDIYLAVVPEWLIRRKNQLRTLWQQADYPTSNFTALMVDPDIVTESDLMRRFSISQNPAQPRPVSQNPAYTLWVARKKVLQDRRRDLNKLGTITSMLTDVFSAAIDLATWDAISTKLQSVNSGDVDSGKNDLKALDASLTPETFSFLLELAHREVDNQEVKAEEREQAIDVLVNLFKLKQFTNWQTEERTAAIKLSAPFFLLSAEEPVLNPLRASSEARGNWRAELERNSTLPLIDPDIIGEANFAPGNNSTTADETWTSRRQLVGDGRHADDTDPPGTLFQAVATIDSVAKLNAALTSGDLLSGQPPNQVLRFHYIGFIAAQLSTIDEDFKLGRKLSVTPEQYGLTVAELRTLFEVRRLGTNADASDWEQVHHILVQAEKRRYLYPLWRIEELIAGISLNPDVFHLPSDGLADFLPPLGLTPGFLQWRRDTGRQRTWREQLKARIEQERAIDVELQTAIDAAEEASLPTLRDDLVMATVTSVKARGESLEERKRWVMNNLLINAFENGCRKTTRVAQAIETIQLLLWGIDGGQLESEKYSLESESAGTFAEEWRWLGSYATWRSAMFTYLYPENLLLPELRRAIEGHPDPDTDPTKLFRAILKVVSGEALPPSAPDSTEDGAGEPQSTEDEELTPIVADIFNVLDKTDPLTINGQRKIYGQLIGSWSRIYRRVTDTSEMGPIDNWENKWWAVTEFSQYTSSSAFLEDTLYIPLTYALTQFKRGNFEDALYWFSQVYDFRGTSPSNSNNQGWVNHRLELYFKQRGATGIASLNDWLNDKLNPHLIAATRTGADVRFVILSIGRCLLDYADSEFAKDTSESLARARELYETARHLLNSSQLGKELPNCGDIIDLISEIGQGHYKEIIRPELEPHYPDFSQVDIGDGLMEDLKGVIEGIDPLGPRFEVRRDIHNVVARYFAPNAPKTLDKIRVDGNLALNAVHQRMLDDSRVFQQVQRMGISVSTALPLVVYGVGSYPGVVAPEWVPAPNKFRFCIPRNPLIALLRLRFEVSWFKLNNCMNLAGQHREVPAYAAPTDTYSGLPVADIGSTAGFSAAARLVPTLYRYRVLIDRAKQLFAMAQQMESTYLSFLEKRDQEAYTILRARQDLGIARANVTLQDLKVTEADAGKDLADSQFNRTKASLDHYENLLDEELLGSEETALNSLRFAVILQTLAIPASAADPSSGFGLANAAQAQSLISSFQSTSATYQRREEEWKFQRDLAEIDQGIAEAQQALAEDRYQIVLQEKRISELSAENASDVVNFLNAKFTNTELYAWMGGIVGGIYRYLLQEATTIAKLAQRQLAFERQETELAVVLDDYWTYTDTSAILRGDSGSTDRRGMTGSARLLQDITRLDQEAFLTDRRKLQLSKTFSLVLLDPIAFARFQTSGVLPFSTTLEQFDRNFPGHYLRLIKRVRVSVIALVPPTEGIRATLSSSGISRAVQGGNTFAEIEIQRDPESIAFTSPINATGLFELQEQPEMLLPFESNGVAASWTFSMLRAANVVDYSTIADVLVSIEYTALDSPIYRSQVIQRLDRTTSGERPFSFRQQFADCWYDLNNSKLLEDDRQMRVTFETRRSDFPPNVTDLSIQHVSLYFVRQDGFTDSIRVESLLFTEAGSVGHVGGAATTNNGLISTREANGGSWLSMKGNSTQSKQPIGKWELKLPNTDEVKDWFKNGKIEDILFVITFGGTTPEWPR